MITTDKFDLTKNEYLLVTLKVLFKKKWWEFLLFWALAIFITFESDIDEMLLFCLFFLYGLSLIHI